MRLAFRLFAAVVAFCLSWALPRCVWAEEQKHIRIVLDTSLSMAHTAKSQNGNDPHRLAVLSALLLHDLARPNLGTGDTFRVIPFKQNWPNPKAGGPDPKGVGTILEPGVFGSASEIDAARNKLATPLSNLAYNAANTYFVPGLDEAASELEDLKKNKNVDCASARCVVVLLTDGLPEGPTRDDERQKLHDKILPRLEKLGAIVYVLAFGQAIQDSSSDASNFFQSVLDVPGPNQRGRLGQLLIDPTGDLLPKYMVQIFSEAFGYEAEGPNDLAAVRNIILAGQDNQESIVVAFHLDPTPPDWELRAPPGSKHVPDTLWKGTESDSHTKSGASYSLQRIYRPDKGATYAIEPRGPVSSSGSPKVMVLRPAKLDIEIRPRPPATKIFALSGRKFPVEILVKPRVGSGAPDGVSILYDEAGREVKAPDKYFSWSNDPSVLDAPDKRPEGAVFKVDLDFRPEGPKPYTGHLEVKLFRGQAPLASKQKDKAFPIEVYPSVRVNSDSDHFQITPSILRKGQKGCGTFMLKPDDQQPLPHPDKPEYMLRAFIKKLPATPALDGAQYTLDGQPLEVDGSTPKPTGDWYNGVKREPKDVFAAHQLCVIAGKPAADADVEVPVVFLLNEDPYDQVEDVFAPVKAKVRLVPPDPIAQWGVWALIGGGPLLLLLALYYLRHRPDLPDDLRAAVGPPGGALTPQALGEGSLARRLLGLPRERQVYSPDGGDILGWVRPVEHDLYLFRPVQGAVSAVAPAARPGEPLAGEEGARLHVHRRYQVEKDGHRYDLRLEYGR